MFTQPGTIVKHETIPGAILFQKSGYVTISEEPYEDSRITLSIKLIK